MLTLFLTRSRLGLLLIVFGATLGLIAAYDTIIGNRNMPQPPTGALTSKSAPSSVRPNTQAVANYVVPADNPKYLAIPAIGIGLARIIRLGLTTSNQIAVPANIYDTGWYGRSAKPGQDGAMFIYGHVSSWAATGVFFNLKKLKPGDEITITRGDGATYTYKVASTKTYPFDKVPMAVVLAPTNPNVPGLNLMTCAGNIIKGTSDFDERLVVYTNLATR